MAVLKLVVVLACVAVCYAESSDCSQAQGIEGSLTCTAFKTLSNLEDLSTQQNIEILPGISLTSDTPRSMRSGKSLEFPVEAEKRITKLIDMMYNVLNNIFSGRTLKFRFPEDAAGNFMRALEEGRGKVKKISPLIMAIGAKVVALIPLLVIGLALKAIKAIVLAKIAFIIVLFLAFKTFGSAGSGILGKFGIGGGAGGAGWNGGGAGWNGGGAGWNGGYAGYPYARSSEEAQNIVYAAQKP